MNTFFHDTIVIVQARIASKRLPKKVLRSVYGTTLLEHLLYRIYYARLSTVLAVPECEVKNFKPIVKTMQKHWLNKYRIANNLTAHKPLLMLHGGSNQDVLSRYHQASTCFIQQHRPIRTIVRVTADNPFTSMYCLVKLIAAHKHKGADVSYYRGLPYGAGVEVIELSALKQAHELATDTHHREHITQYFYAHQNRFTVHSPKSPKSYYAPNLRVTVDTIADLNFFKQQVKTHLKCSYFYRQKKVVPLLKIIESALNEQNTG